MRLPLLLLLAVCVVSVFAAGRHQRNRPCTGEKSEKSEKSAKAPCKGSASHGNRRQRSSHQESGGSDQKNSADSDSSDESMQCKFECAECRAPVGHSSLFIGKSVIIDTSKGVIEPDSTNCKCNHGTQYSYRAINPQNDFGAIFYTNNLVVARLRCERQSDMCIETATGQLFHGIDGQPADLIPVPYTSKMGKARTYMAVYPAGWTNATDLSTALSIEQAKYGFYMQNELDVENFQYETQTDANGVTTRRLNFEEYFYIPIIGIDCNGCRWPIRYCDKAIRNTYAR